MHAHRFHNHGRVGEKMEFQAELSTIAPASIVEVGVTPIVPNTEVARIVDAPAVQKVASQEFYAEGAKAAAVKLEKISEVEKNSEEKITITQGRELMFKFMMESYGVNAARGTNADPSKPIEGLTFRCQNSCPSTLFGNGWKKAAERDVIGKNWKGCWVRDTPAIVRFGQASRDRSGGTGQALSDVQNTFLALHVKQYLQLKDEKAMRKAAGGKFGALSSELERTHGFREKLTPDQIKNNFVKLFEAHKLLNSEVKKTVLDIIGRIESAQV